MRLSRLLTFVLILTPATRLLAEAPSRPVAKMTLADGDAIVFLGDSITHQCLYTQYVEDYFLTRYPNVNIRFHNAGVSGDRCADALMRFDEDVAKYKPKYVTVLLGMNDGTYRPYDQETFDVYQKGVEALIEKIIEIGATPVLMTPTMFDARAARVGKRKQEPRDTYYNSTLAYYGAYLRERALEKGLGFVDMYGPLNAITLQERKRKPAFTLIQDAVHPGAAGQAIMASAILQDLAPSRIVWMLDVDYGPTPTAKGRGCEASDLSASDGGLSFTLLANALPLVLPEEAQLGAKLAHIGHRLGKEALRVQGLPKGEYELKIDGNVVGVYGADALARGVELEDNPKTPQYQQALKVAMLNKTRNDEVVHPLRDLWSAKKAARIVADRLKADANHEVLKKEVESANGRLDRFKERIKELEEKSAERFKEIDQARKPLPHKYELRPVGANSDAASS